MLKKSVIREIIFFAMIFLLFFLSCKLSRVNIFGLNTDLKIMLVGAVFTGCVVGLYYLVKNGDHKDNYRLLEISPGAQCRGGPYMWQGDSKTAQMCRNLDKTAEGKCEIAKFQCPNGYHGQPGRPLEFTSNSNSCWDGVKCKGGQVDKAYYDKQHDKDCKCGLCSMWVEQQCKE